MYIIEHIIVLEMRLIFLLLFIFSQLNASVDVQIHAGAYILMNAETGAILAEKESNRIAFPASVTKIATAIYTLERGGANLDNEAEAHSEALITVTQQAKELSQFTLPPYWIDIEGTKIGLVKGEKMPLKDLLYGLMLCSGNDAANVIAQHVGGTIKKFVEQLNAYMQELGCVQTHFLNPSGLHHPNHHTTACDLAILTRHALKNSTFCEIVGAIRWIRPETNLQEPRTLYQENRLLRQGPLYYSKAIGVKPGYTSAAKHTLVAAAKHEDRLLIAVLLENPNREQMFRDARTLFEAAFREKKVKTAVIPKGPVAFYKKIFGGERPVQAESTEAFCLECYPSEEPDVQAIIDWSPLKLPVEKGSDVGRLRIESKSGDLISSIPLVAYQTVEESILSKIQDGFIESKQWGGWLLGGMFIAALFSAWRSKHRRRR